MFKCKEHMVQYFYPHLVDITKVWANKDISDAELERTGYVLFRRDRSPEEGVILYINTKSIQAFEIKLERE